MIISIRTIIISNSFHNLNKINFDQITLKSSFNRQVKIIPNVSYLQRLNSDSSLNLYCCGPTVYAHSHLGHAISYIRCDLIIRMLKTFCNTNVFFAMNITDIDDKIINKSHEIGLNYRDISNEYFQSFTEDMNSLRITRPDFFGKVLDNIDVIADYIKQIYNKGYAYFNPETGDINFDYEKFITEYSIKNEIKPGNNLLTTKSKGKRSPKDFALWKAFKPNEPKWTLKLNEDLLIAGRPGWHVECSALSHLIFGSKIDIHFGGIDLLFPHHHCESCCSHVYQYKPEFNKELYSNVNVWLHSGHLILRSEKMSKSLGNVILIKDFLQKYSPNILRLLCIRSHYRTEIDFDEKLLLEMTAHNEKLHEFVQYIEWVIYKLSANSLKSLSQLIDGSRIEQHHMMVDPLQHSLISLIDDLEDSIWKGILDDLNLNAALEVILKLSEIFPKMLPFWFEDDHMLLYQCIRLRILLCRWFDATALDYGLNTSMEHINQMAIVEHLTEFRKNIRQSALDMLKMLRKMNNERPLSDRCKTKNNEDHLQEEMIKILSYCDQTRSYLERQGIKLKDQPTSSSSAPPSSSLSS